MIIYGSGMHVGKNSVEMIFVQVYLIKKIGENSPRMFSQCNVNKCKQTVSRMSWFEGSVWTLS